MTKQKKWTAQFERRLLNKFPGSLKLLFKLTMKEREKIDAEKTWEREIIALRVCLTMKKAIR